MVHYDGYYIEEPFELIDKRATGSSSFVLSAYLFKEGGIVYLSTQIKLAHQIKDFTKHDFEKKSIELKFKANKNSLTLIGKSKFSQPYDLKFISSDEFLNSLTNKRGYFVPWRKSQSNNERLSPILNQLFGPFESGKFETKLV